MHMHTLTIALADSRHTGMASTDVGPLILIAPALLQEVLFLVILCPSLLSSFLPASLLLYCGDLPGCLDAIKHCWSRMFHGEQDSEEKNALLTGTFLFKLFLISPLFG